MIRWERLSKTLFVWTAIVMVNGFYAPMVHGVSMETLHAQFEQMTGKKWADATEEEKRHFLRGPSVEKEEKIEKGKKKEYDKPSNGAGHMGIETTLETRKRFAQQNGRQWDEASADEQRAFIKRHKEQKQKEVARRRKEDEKKKAQRLKEESLRQKAIQKREQKIQKAKSREQKERARFQRDVERKKRDLDKMLKNIQKGHRR